MSPHVAVVLAVVERPAPPAEARLPQHHEQLTSPRKRRVHRRARANEVPADREPVPQATTLEKAADRISSSASLPTPTHVGGMAR
jgi:hypothetical protein